MNQIHYQGTTISIEIQGHEIPNTNDDLHQNFYLPFVGHTISINNNKF